MRGVAHWAIAVRKPSAEQLAEGGHSPEEASLGEIEVKSFPLDSALKRHRVLRLPIIRGIVALGGSLAIGFRALEFSANAQLPPDEAGGGAEAVGEDGAAPQEGEPQEIPKAVWFGTVVVALALAIVLFFLIPVGPHEPDQGPAELLGAVLADRGVGADRDLPRLPAAALAAARSAARVRVPRRRAQDDLLLRGRPAADPRQRPALLAPAPPLRHELPADRHDRGDLRVRADRAAGLVLAGADADPRRAADRRHLVRDHQVRRQEPQARRGCRR